MPEPTPPHGNEESVSTRVAVAVSSVRAPYPESYSQEERETALHLATFVTSASYGAPRRLKESGIEAVGNLVIVVPPDDHEDDPIGYKRVQDPKAGAFITQQLREAYDNRMLAMLQ